MKKTDIRVKFTQKVLKNSLIDIMKTKPILNITIKEICTKADVSRSTFYTYYKDQYDLLRQMEDETFIEIEKITEEYKNRKRIMSGSGGRFEILQHVLNYVTSNSNSIQVLLGENGDAGFQMRFLNKCLKLTRQFMKSTVTGEATEKTIKYVSVFMIGGSLSLLHEWLRNNLDTPVPEMARIMSKLLRDVAM